MNSFDNYKNIFLDRDGIINEVIFRESAVSSPRNIDEFVLRKDFISFYDKFKNKKIFFVVTNQPDISRELMNLDDLKKMHTLLNQKFNFKKIVYCPHDDSDNCACRKPKPGMINSLINEFSLNRNECLIIGDSMKDMQSGRSAKIDCIFLQTKYNKKIDKFDGIMVNNLGDL